MASICGLRAHEVSVDPKKDEVCQICVIPKTQSLHYFLHGDGDPRAQIVLVGEGPGREEEAQNKVFVGRAGQLLNRALGDAGLFRSEVYITNVTRGRPRNALGENRKPKPYEIAACRPFLTDELEGLRNKKVIVAMGDAALEGLFAEFKPEGGVTRLQGRVIWSELWRCWIVCTIHPAYVGRRPSEYYGLVEDLLKAALVAREGQPRTPPEIPFTVVLDFDAADRMKADLLSPKTSKIIFDFETAGNRGSSGLDLNKAIAFCVGFSAGPGRTYVVPRFRSGLIPAWPREQLRRLDEEYIVPILLSDIEKGGHHVAFDQNVSYTTWGIWPNRVTFCTMIKSHTVDNHLPERMHGLKRLADRTTPYGLYDEPLDTWLVEHGYTEKEGVPDYNFIWMVPDELLWKYLAADVHVPYILNEKLDARLKEEHLVTIYNEERFPLCQEYMVADRRGVRIAGKNLLEVEHDLGEVIEGIEARLKQIVGPDFNPGSQQQVAKYLFKDLEYPVLVRTPTGLPSVTEEVLVQYREQLPEFIPLELHHRSFTKMKSTFVDGGKKGKGGLILAVDWETMRAAMSTQLIAAETFRLATRRPFPIHVLPRPLDMWNCTTHGKYQFPAADGTSPCCDQAVPVVLSLRSLLIPDPGWKFLCRDYRQQEMTIQAIFAKQRDMEEAILDRHEDVHDFVMQVCTGKSGLDFGGTRINYEWKFPNKSQAAAFKNFRTDYKNADFAALFRAQEKKFAKMTKKSIEEAERLLSLWNSKFPDIRRWQDEVIKELYRHGRVWGAFGTYRILPGAGSDFALDRYEAERQGCNFKIQEAGAHIMFRAILRFGKAVRGGRAPWQKAAFPARFAFSVHDEMCVMARDDVVEEADAIMRKAMEDPHDELVGACGIRRGIPTSGGRPQLAWG